MLLTEGFEVATAIDGKQGLEELNAREFDIVVLDLQMPEMDGRSLYWQMRSQGIATPVVVFTAYGASAAQKELNSEAALNKPFDPDALIDVIRGLCPPPPMVDRDLGPDQGKETCPPDSGQV